MIYDTHCHPYLNSIKNQDKIITNYFNNWWKYLNIIWTNIDTSNKAIELAKNFHNVFATIWIHPCDINWLDLEKTITTLKKIYSENKKYIVWIWECGLDYHWEKDEDKRQKQKIFFEAQIKLAQQLDLPVIIHNRDSSNDIFEIIKNTNLQNFVFHCYTENLEYAKKLINFAPNCKISFSGIVTFNSAKEVQNTVKNIPLEYIIAETDAPYLTPTPFRWKQENEPLYCKYIVEYINNLRWKDCTKEIYNNSIEIFKK
jgi:TatD DNase family protein